MSTVESSFYRYRYVTDICCTYVKCLSFLKDLLHCCIELTQ